MLESVEQKANISNVNRNDNNEISKRQNICSDEIQIRDKTSTLSNIREDTNFNTEDLKNTELERIYSTEGRASLIRLTEKENTVEKEDIEASEMVKIVSANITSGTNTLTTASTENSNADAGKSVFKSLSLLDRLLPLFILIAMIVGVLLGYYTNISKKLDTAKIDTVSIPIAIGLWLMIIPVLCKVRYELLLQIFKEKGMWKEIGFALFMNWIIGPFLMTGLAWATLPDLHGYRNGLILVGIARCIGMVLIWINISGGDGEFGAILVAVNSILQIALYAPLAVFYIKILSHQGDQVKKIDLWDITRTVLVFLGAPLIAGIVIRYLIICIKGKTWLEKRFLAFFEPVALIALVYIILILFAMQGKQVIKEIVPVIRVVIPLVLYFSIIWILTFMLSRRCMKSTYPRVVTQAFTTASNNFELAITIGVGTFGVESQEVLAATVGSLVEVPAMLSLIYLCLWLKKKLKWNH